MRNMQRTDRTASISIIVIITAFGYNCSCCRKHHEHTYLNSMETKKKRGNSRAINEPFKFVTTNDITYTYTYIHRIVMAFQQRQTLSMSLQHTPHATECHCMQNQIPIRNEQFICTKNEWCGSWYGCFSGSALGSFSFFPCVLCSCSRAAEWPPQ